MQKMLGIGGSAMSRNVGLLGSTGYRNGVKQVVAEGLGLMVTFEDPADRRQKLVSITPKGRAVVARALDCLER
ncbi:hypothetical protein HMPREF0731_3165 [Pseudoroseomonas cervicalis ATCC 49957]|uniref:HTH marR-type domain-containing protein n=1 Tax=Pseudoroseomonas cervicalis ATCC 49957 TaxID=525371 RepID=D5RQ03_9PROT|nr:hypothetical protein HMPREF0731_3165 [Pseudoroseomonas cervicalis ATCC 49957]